jgi:esterase/lipase
LGNFKTLCKSRFQKAHQPLLFIAGEKDNIMPASLNKRNFKAYKNADSVTDFKMFEGRGHYICGEENWEEVATYVYNWIND